jgi:glycosyltransferase involved in cell wall biosynthesis
MAEAILHVLESESLATSLADAAQERARNFDWAVIAQSLLDYYEASGA